MSDNVYFGVDRGAGKDVTIEDRVINPTHDHPYGSWLHIVDGDVQIATGEYAKQYPGKQSPHMCDGTPFLVMNVGERHWPWEKVK